jgi:hypothetical protein
MSLPLYLQLCGRGSRTSAGKSHFIVLDFGQNVQRHGFWRQTRNWSLDIVKPPKTKKGVGEQAMASCPSCRALIPARARKCIFCGWEQEPSLTEQVTVKLREMTPTEALRFAGTASVDELEILRQARGWKQGFVMHRLKTKADFLAYEALKGYKRGWAMTNGNRYLRISDGWQEWYGKGNIVRTAGYEEAQAKYEEVV